MFSKATSSGPEPTGERRKTTTSSMPSIVSANLRITGDLVSDGDIQVEGAINGNVKSRMLTVGESGSVNGEIVADQLVVAGTVVGTIKARTITFGPSATVTGDVSHESLGIEAGARFEGKCKRLVEGSTKVAAGIVDALPKESAPPASPQRGAASGDGKPEPSVRDGTRP